MRIPDAGLVALVSVAALDRAVVAVPWRHDVQGEDSVRFLEKHLDESVGEGYRVTAVIADVAHHAVLLSRRKGDATAKSPSSTCCAPAKQTRSWRPGFCGPKTASPCSTS